MDKKKKTHYVRICINTSIVYLQNYCISKEMSYIKMCLLRYIWISMGHNMWTKKTPPYQTCINTSIVHLWNHCIPTAVIRPRCYKTFFMLNSAEHEIFSAMFSKKEFAIVSYLRFISMKNSMLSWGEHEKSFITSGPDCAALLTDLVLYCICPKDTFLHGLSRIFIVQHCPINYTDGYWWNWKLIA